LTELSAPLSEQIDIVVDEEFREMVDERQVREIVLQVLHGEGICPPCQVSLVFTDSEIVQGLNRDYRGLDEPTDVLAFPLLSQHESDPAFTLPPDGITHLGEVIISCPQTAQQAREQGHSFERELAVLIIHGMLHLLGFDHEEPGDETRMRDREKTILERCL
jgi:probable rRNA maturation factor